MLKLYLYEVYSFIDIAFLIFHSAIVLFNIFGWIWKRTRRWNLYLLLLTGASWGILGIWYGFGYCPCTDWHWDVLREMGKEPNTPSYIGYLLNRIFGIDISAVVVGHLTLWTFVAALIISIVLNIKDWRRRKNA
ncbi:DUF2784 domain-containing protein [Flavobacteriaceae bacterium TK19130]|nr:DUF2784 domain-containing protein [Thermobacterium salinum]